MRARSTARFFLLTAIFLLAAASMGCQKVCEPIIVYPSDTDLGDLDFPEADPDKDPDNILDNDRDRLDGDADPVEEEIVETETDGTEEIEPEEADPEEGEIEEESGPVEVVLPYDGRELFEMTPNGLIVYTERPGETEGEVVSEAAMYAAFGEEEPIFPLGDDIWTAPPPSRSSVVKVNASVAWAAYKPARQERYGLGPNDFILRLESDAILSRFTVETHVVTAPSDNAGELTQVGVLIQQAESDSTRVNLLLVYVDRYDESGAQVTFQSFRASVSLEGSVSLTPLSLPVVGLPPHGIHPDALMSVQNDGRKIWVNSGSTLTRFSESGLEPVTEFISFPADNVLRADILDFSASPDGTTLSLVTRLEILEQAEPTILWSLHRTSAPAVAIRSAVLPGTDLSYRTSFTPDSLYALVQDADPTHERPLLSMTVRTASTPRTHEVVSYGRPWAIEGPLSLIWVWPFSVDDFATTEVRLDRIPLTFTR